MTSRLSSETITMSNNRTNNNDSSPCSSSSSSSSTNRKKVGIPKTMIFSSSNTATNKNNDTNTTKRNAIHQKARLHYQRGMYYSKHRKWKDAQKEFQTCLRMRQFRNPTSTKDATTVGTTTTTTTTTQIANIYWCLACCHYYSAVEGTSTSNSSTSSSTSSTSSTTTNTSDEENDDTSTRSDQLVDQTSKRSNQIQQQEDYQHAMIVAWTGYRLEVQQYLAVSSSSSNKKKLPSIRRRSILWSMLQRHPIHSKIVVPLEQVCQRYQERLEQSIQHEVHGDELAGHLWNAKDYGDNHDTTTKSKRKLDVDGAILCYMSAIHILSNTNAATATLNGDGKKQTKTITTTNTTTSPGNEKNHDDTTTTTTKKTASTTNWWAKWNVMNCALLWRKCAITRLHPLKENAKEQSTSTTSTTTTKTCLATTLVDVWIQRGDLYLLVRRNYRQAIGCYQKAFMKATKQQQQQQQSGKDPPNNQVLPSRFKKVLRKKEQSTLVPATTTTTKSKSTTTKPAAIQSSNNCHCCHGVGDECCCCRRRRCRSCCTTCKNNSRDETIDTTEMGTKPSCLLDFTTNDQPKEDVETIQTDEKLMERIHVMEQTLESILRQQQKQKLKLSPLSSFKESSRVVENDETIENETTKFRAKDETPIAVVSSKAQDCAPQEMFTDENSLNEAMGYLLVNYDWEEEDDDVSWTGSCRCEEEGTTSIVEEYDNCEEDDDEEEDWNVLVLHGNELKRDSEDDDDKLVVVLDGGENDGTDQDEDDDEWETIL